MVGGRQIKIMWEMCGELLQMVGSWKLVPLTVGDGRLAARNMWEREVDTRVIPQALMSRYRSATHNVDICFQLEHIN